METPETAEIMFELKMMWLGISGYFAITWALVVFFARAILNAQLKLIKPKTK